MNKHKIKNLVYFHVPAFYHEPNGSKIQKERSAEPGEICQ